MSGATDASISFEDLCQFLRRLGFVERIRGDHHIFTRDGVDEILNIQPKGTKAKPYQVKQVRNVIRKYNLDVEEDE
jgi:predicted RNA binding protein YcfA (HicA-like mRNA interferase family)